jgi:hypothetical protein
MVKTSWARGRNPGRLVEGKIPVATLLQLLFETTQSKQISEWHLPGPRGG